MISTADPHARHPRKSPEARSDGYRAHLAADPETGLITDEKLTKAAGQENSDPAVAAESPAAEAGPEELRRRRMPAPARADEPGAGRPPAAADAARSTPTRTSRLPGTATPSPAPATCAARSQTPGTRR